jgi:hypothetical protein
MHCIIVANLLMYLYTQIGILIYLTTDGKYMKFPGWGIIVIIWLAHIVIISFFGYRSYYKKGKLR